MRQTLKLQTGTVHRAQRKCEKSRLLELIERDTLHLPKLNNRASSSVEKSPEKKFCCGPYLCKFKHADKAIAIKLLSTMHITRNIANHAETEAHTTQSALKTANVQAHTAKEHDNRNLNHGATGRIRGAPV